MTNPTRLPVRDAIIEAAFKVLNADPSASLGEIASAAGVGRATLHRHFNGRADLVCELTRQAMRETAHAADMASRNALSYSAAIRKIFKAIIPLGDRHWFLAHEPLQALPDVCAQTKKQESEFIKLVEKAKKEGLFHSSCPTEWFVLTYDHLIHAAWEMVRKGHATDAQAADIAWTTLIQGLKKAKH